MNKVLIAICFLLFISCDLMAQGNGKNTYLEAEFVGEKALLDKEWSEKMDQKFKAYKVYNISTDQINNYLKTRDYQGEINLKLDQQFDWDLQLNAYEVVAPQITRKQGNTILQNLDIKTYKGSLNHSTEVRLTIADNFIAGMIDTGSDKYYIEPVNKSDLQANDNTFIIYNVNDVRKSADHVCGIEATQKVANQMLPNYSGQRLDTDTGESPCRRVDVAQAYESGILTRYGSNANVSTWNAAIWNVVNGFYVGAIAYDIEFVIIAEFFDPPFAVDACITNYLNNFKAWGNGGGFGTTAYDLGNLWTTTDVTGCTAGSNGVIGSVMEIGGICTADRYQIFEDFVGPTGVPPTGGALAALSVLIAHEVGHNVGMWHNDPAGANIMEPGLNANATTFSETSKHYLRSRLKDLACLSTCFCVEVVQAVPINCSPDGSTFDLELTVEHDNTSGTFTASAGGVTSSQAYGANPQTITLTGVPSGTTNITVTDDGAPSCTHTSVMQLPNPQGVSVLTTTEYCETTVGTAPTQNLSATYMENFGSITVTLNSDGDPTNGLYAISEQSLQIIDVNGNVVGDIPIQTGGFNTTNPTILTVTDLNLDPEFAPYAVIVGDQYGDGLVAGTCFGGDIFDGGYTIEDGQGNVTFNGTLQDDGSCGNGNNAVSATNTITPAIDYTTGGNFSGPGVTDGTADDGAAVFDPSGLAVGQHFIDYEMDTYEGCIAERQIVHVYAQPIITFNSSTCTGSTYSATVTVDLGAWNSVLAGNDAAISVSSSAGTPSSTSINANGTIMITGIPSGQNATITVGNGTDNGGCQNQLIVNGLVCATCDPPTAPTCSAPSSTTLDVAWTAPGTAPDGYIVQYSSDNGTTWATVETATNQHPWINEIHYDNTSGDVDEGVEIAGPAGLDLSCYSIIEYNGAGGVVISDVALSGTIDDEGAGFGAIWTAETLQNGPDGVALIYNGDASCGCPGATSVVQFLSWEGIVNATEGPASGMASVNMGVSQSGDPLGTSLQLDGCGAAYADFTWSGQVAATAGDLNVGQEVYLQTTTSLTAINLDPCTDYVFQVASFCCGTGITAYAGPTTICSTLEPNVALTVTTDSPVCEGEDATVTIVGSEVGVDYQVVDGADAAISTVVAGTGGNITLTIPSASIPTVGGSPYAFNVEATVCNCTVDLSTAISIVVENCCPTDPSITADVAEVCGGGSATITGQFGGGTGTGTFTITGDNGIGTVMSGMAVTLPANNTCAPIVYTFTATATCDNNGSTITETTAGDLTATVTVYPNAFTVMTDGAGACGDTHLDIVAADGSTVCADNVATASCTLPLNCTDPPTTDSGTYTNTFFTGTACAQTFSNEMVTCSCAPPACACPTDPSITADVTEVCGGGSATITGQFGGGTGTGTFTITGDNGIGTVMSGMAVTLPANNTCAPIVYTFTATATCDDNGSTVSETTAGDLTTTVTVYPNAFTVVTDGAGACGDTHLDIVAADGTSVCADNVATASCTLPVNCTDPATTDSGTYTNTFFTGTACAQTFSNEIVTCSCAAPACDCPTDPMLSADITDACGTGSVTLSTATVGTGTATFTITGDNGIGTVTAGTPITLPANNTCDPIVYTFTATATCDDNAATIAETTAGDLTTTVTVYPNAFTVVTDGTSICGDTHLDVVAADGTSICADNVATASCTQPVNCTDPNATDSDMYSNTFFAGTACPQTFTNEMVACDCPAPGCNCPTDPSITADVVEFCGAGGNVTISSQFGGGSGTGIFTIMGDNGIGTVTAGTPITLPANNTCDPIAYTFTASATCDDDNSAIAETTAGDLTAIVTVYPNAFTVVTDGGGACGDTHLDIVAADGNTVCADNVATASCTQPTLCTDPDATDSATYSNTFFAGTSCTQTFTNEVVTCSCVAPACTCPTDPSITADVTEVCGSGSVTISGQFGGGTGTGTFMIMGDNGIGTVMSGMVVTLPANNTCDPIVYTFTATATCDDDNSTVAETTAGDLTTTVTVYPNAFSVVTDGDGACGDTHLDIVAADGNTVCADNVATASCTQPTNCGVPDATDSATYNNTFFVGTACAQTFTNEMVSCACAAPGCNCPTDPMITADVVELCASGNVTITSQFGGGTGTGTFTIMGDNGIGAVMAGSPIALPTNNTCNPIVYTFTAMATCDDDNSTVAETTAGDLTATVTVYPAPLSVTIVDNGSTCGTPAVELYSADNSLCASQTGTTCVNDGDQFDYDFATDLTWIGSEPTACTQAVSGSIMCANCGVSCTATAGDMMVNDSNVCTDGITGMAIGAIFNPDISVGYDNWILLTDASGNILDIFGIGDEVTIPFSDFEDIYGVGQDFCLYSYNFLTDNWPDNVPDPDPFGIISGTATVADIGNTVAGCFELSDPVCFTVPTCICDLSVEVVLDNGNSGSVSPFYYNTAEVDIANGTPPYYYEWSQSGYVRPAIINTPDPVVGGANEIRIIYADNAMWTVTVTDANGCQIIATNDPTDGMGGVTEILDITGADVEGDLCTTRGVGEGSITVYVEHGTPPYTYNWAGPLNWTNTNAVTGTPWTGGGGLGETYTLTDLPYGWYALTVTDSGDPNGPFDANGGVIIDSNPNTPLPQQMSEGWYWVACNRSTGGGRGKVGATIPTLNINPNPVTNETNIEFSLPEQGELIIELFDLQGRKMLILFKGAVEAKSLNNMIFEAGPLTNGVYVVVLTDEKGERIYERLMIAK